MHGNGTEQRGKDLRWKSSAKNRGGIALPFVEQRSNGKAMTGHALHNNGIE